MVLKHLATLILSLRNSEHDEATILNILDQTSLDQHKLIIINSSFTSLKHDNIIYVENIDKPRTILINSLMKDYEADYYVLLRGPCKVSTDWIERLLLYAQRHNDCIVSPIVHALNINNWSSEAGRYKTTTLSMDLNLRDRPNDSGIDTVVCTNYCMVIPRTVVNKIGYFDESIIEGYGDDVEYSLRHLASNGRNIIDKSVFISSQYTIDQSLKTCENKARISELWLKHRSPMILERLKINPNTVRMSKLAYPSQCDWLDSKTLIDKHLRHLGDIYDLKNKAYSKSVAVIAPGKSIDFTNAADIMSHDIIIGVDGAALLYECDYAVTDNLQMVATLLEKYDTNKLIISDVLENRLVGEYVSADGLTEVKYRFERLRKGIMPSVIDPPFCDLNNIALTALHIALFMNPKTITLYGFDTHLLDGKSHTDRGIYGDGKLIPDSESAEKTYALAELGASSLSKIALSYKIPVLRVSHL